MDADTKDQITLNDGDIFRWRYADEEERCKRDFGSYMYHCKSMIAVAANGRLFDTYWHSTNSDYEIDPAQVTLKFQGNPKDMTLIPKWERAFYRSEDIVDMNHANNSGAPIYAKAGATRDPETMAAYFKHAKERFESNARSAQDRAADCGKALAAIAAGEIHGDFPSFAL